ncbi:MAG TPA: hypothetical protein VN581_14320, partial [Patescibacteria group bacterium]|nr:hypothetical protein [Patescibacteria group bacterium]
APSLFYDGATGDAVPTIFRALTRRGDIQWIWIRTDDSNQIGDIEKIVAQTLEEFGLPFQRIEARMFSDAMRERLQPQLTERNTALTASFVLLALSVVASFALFAFAGRTRAKEFALRLAIGATPASAMIGLLRSGVWMPVAGLAMGWIVSASAVLPVLAILGLRRGDLALAMVIASMVTALLQVMGLLSTARTVAQGSLRETLAET